MLVLSIALILHENCGENNMVLKLNPRKTQYNSMLLYLPFYLFMLIFKIKFPLFNPTLSLNVK
jgi:hypothetical protein